MKSCRIIAAVGVLCSSWSSWSHPSSGIVVNANGEVFFVHSARGVAKIERDGKLTYVHESTGGHWLCLDPEGHFSKIQPKHFLRITPEGARPAIVFADGGAPIAVGDDGNLYYGSGGRENEPGAETISRLTREGIVSGFAPKLTEELARQRAGVTGLTAGRDGALYVASAVSIVKVVLDGSVKTVVERPNLKDCDANPPPDGLPGFQGIDVLKDGTIYAAATGCRTVIRISSGGEVQTVLKSEAPWSPTAVAVHNEELYVLEWTNPNEGAEAGWRPRVRKVDKSGMVTTLVTVTENVKASPRR